MKTVSYHSTNDKVVIRNLFFSIKNLKEFFENPAFRADGLKIYPTLVIRGTGLYELWKTGRYKVFVSRHFDVANISNICCSFLLEKKFNLNLFHLPELPTITTHRFGSKSVSSSATVDPSLSCTTRHPNAAGQFGC